MRLRDFQVDINKNLLGNLKKVSELFGEVSESLQNPRARLFLTSALEFLKPHHLALGLRISKLSTTRVEVVVPARRRNLLDSGELDPGILTSAAVMAAHLFLRRIDQPDMGPLTLDEIHFNRLSPLIGEVRGRLEFSKLAQETFRIELKKKQQSKIELLVIFYDQFDMRAADCQLVFSCKAVGSIGWEKKNARN